MKNYKEDWGNYVYIDLESNVSKPENKKTRPSIIFITKKDKLRYYTKYHRKNLTQSVIILDLFSFNPPALSAHMNFGNLAFPKQNYIKDSVKKEVYNEKTFTFVTMVVSSGLFILLTVLIIFKVDLK